MEDYREAQLALENQGHILLDTLHGLRAEQWSQPTLLEGWDVLTLVAHIVRAPKVLVEYAAKLADQPAQVDRVSYFRFDGTEIAAGVSQRAKEAAAHTTPAQIIVELDERLKAAQATLVRLAPATVITSPYGAIALSEYVITRLLEITVHSLDLYLA